MLRKVYDKRKKESLCTWNPEQKTCPHLHQEFKPPLKICPNIAYAIGNTPMVRINKITHKENIQCEILAKCEYLNPGGSLKDRIGIRMIQDAQASQAIVKGCTLIEPTSGNTGIGLGLAAAAEGYNLTVTMPEKMSHEKSTILKALGANIIRTPTEASFDSPESHIAVAESLELRTPNSKILDQYNNPSNPLVHYDQTAEEILSQCNWNLDYCVIGVGTGGTLTGVSRKLKEKLPSVKIVGVDPVGSIIADPQHDTPGIYKVEGIGYDFVPRVCYSELVDFWYKTTDCDSFVYARRLIREEGLLVGGSSGAVMWAAVQLAKTLSADKRVVVILPDTFGNYLTKFVSDRWMQSNGYMELDDSSYLTCGKSVRDLALREWPCVEGDCTCEEAFNLMTNSGFQELVVMSEGKVLGVVTTKGILSCYARFQKQGSVRKVMVEPWVVGLEFSLSLAVNLLEDLSTVVVQDGDFISLVKPQEIIDFVNKVNPKINY